MVIPQKLVFEEHSNCISAIVFCTALKTITLLLCYRVIFLYTSESDFCLDMCPRGTLAMKMRHLKALGYCVILVRRGIAREVVPIIASYYCYSIYGIDEV